MTQIVSVFLFFAWLPTCSVMVLAWFSPRVGIQRCTTLLIRLFYGVPLHLSSAYCSSEREREREGLDGVTFHSVPVQHAPDCQAGSVKS